MEHAVARWAPGFGQPTGGRGHGDGSYALAEFAKGAKVTRIQAFVLRRVELATAEDVEVAGPILAELEQIWAGMTHGERALCAMVMPLSDPEPEVPE